MVNEQIKQIAKQAGGTPYVNRHYPGETAVAFGPVALNEFVRLVRESVLDEFCKNIKAADDEASDDDYMLDSNDCIKVIRGTWRILK